MTDKARGFIALSAILFCIFATTFSEEVAEATATTPAVDTDNPKIEKEEDSDDHSLDKRATYLIDEIKRAQLGFHGMRGKKGYDTSLSSFSPQVAEWAKRASMGFQGMRGKKWDDDESFDKRAAMGFQGMRGKKGYYYEDPSKRGGSMGFQGMRGKKDEIIEDKRASMGFQGMRGKKMYQDGSYDAFPLVEMNPEPRGLYIEEDKRAMAGFQGMRGKKDEEYDMYKRANMGFYGMRGKKEDGNYIYDNEFQKRAMGFHGMRGKKQNDPSFKRAMGFLGMRGKKAQEDWENRTTPQNIDFDDKVKSDNEDGEGLNNLLSYLTQSNPATSRSRRSVYSTMKKARGFLGMRGKKSWISPDQEVLEEK